MHRFFAILFSFFYFAFSSGLAVKVHYCMDDVFFVQKDSKSCGKCGKKESKNCCKTEVKWMKVDKFQKSAFPHFDHKISAEIPKKIKFVFEDFESIFLAEKLPENNNSPPILGEIPIFIRHCNFRI